MEEIVLNQPEADKIEKKNLLSQRLRRFFIASTVPLALLAVGCSGGSAPKADSAPEGTKLEMKQDNREIEKAEKKMLTECLIRVAGGVEGVDVLDNGDFVVRALESTYYRLDDKAQEEVLIIVKENNPSSDLGLSFRQAEERIQTQLVRQAIEKFGQIVSPDQLTPELKNIENIREDVSRQMSNQELEDFL